MRQLIRFAVQEAASCGYAAGVFALLALTSVVPVPIPRYDALLIGCVTLTAVLWLTGVETGREVFVIGLFHLVGLALELFKVRVGSWSYPQDAYTKIAGVPLYSGFMYAAVGSYLCQAWRRLDLALVGYRPLPTAAAALFVYANFFTHHWLPDLRLLGVAALFAATWHTTVTYRVGVKRYAMPLALSFALIGAFLWLAENAATFLGAWQYPDQGDVWRMVHLSKFGSWALLVSVSFVLVAALKEQHSGARQWRRPVGHPGGTELPRRGRERRLAVAGGVGAVTAPRGRAAVTVDVQTGRPAVRRAWRLEQAATGRPGDGRDG